jgi:hypothetical protein
MLSGIRSNALIYLFQLQPIGNISQQSQNQTAREMMLSLPVRYRRKRTHNLVSEPEESILDTGRIVAELKRERDRLSQAIAALDGQSPKAAARTSAVPNRATRSKKKGDRLTPAGRKRLSDMMKKRWAEKRKKGSKGRK